MLYAVFFALVSLYPLENFSNGRISICIIYLLNYDWLYASRSIALPIPIHNSWYSQIYIQLIRNCYEWQYLNGKCAMKIALLWPFVLKRFIFILQFCFTVWHFIATLSVLLSVFVEMFDGNKSFYRFILGEMWNKNLSISRNRLKFIFGLYLYIYTWNSIQGTR